MKCHSDLEYYINTGKEEVINALDGTLSIEEILDVEDVYIKHFLLTHLELDPIEADVETTRKLRSFLHELGTARRIIEPGPDPRMLKFIREKISFRSTDGCIGCLSEFSIEDIDMEHYRRYFGYAEIYKHYKTVVKTVFSCRYNWREIGIVIVLLNNEALCFKRLLPLFTRLTTYVKEDILDRNIVACCIALKASLLFLPGKFSGRDEYIISLTSYLSMLLSNHTTFAFINERDADVIIDAIETLTRFPFRMSVEGICVGIFRRMLFNVENIIRSSSTVYEEVFAVVCSLEVLTHIHRLIVLTREIPYEFSNVFYELQEFNISEMNQLSPREQNHISERYLAAKYRLLDAIYGSADVSLDRIVVYNDMDRIRHQSVVLGVISEMKREILWSDLIVAACSEGRREEYILFLFDDFFLEQAEHLTYVELYVDAIGDDPDLLLYSGYLLTRAADPPNTRKRWEILVKLYFRDIESLDQRLVRLRELIACHIAGLESSESRRMFIEAVLDRSEEERAGYDPSVIFILNQICRKFDKLPPEVVLRKKRYLRRCFAAEVKRERGTKTSEAGREPSPMYASQADLPRKKGTKRTSISDLERRMGKMSMGRRREEHERRGPFGPDIGAVYVCVAARSLILSGTEVVFEDGTQDEMYFEFLVACVSHRRGRYAPGYYERIRERMFKFLFRAERLQIEELGTLLDEEPYRDRESKYLSTYGELYGTE
jgi:hypothetical protein